MVSGVACCMLPGALRAPFSDQHDGRFGPRCTDIQCQAVLAHHSSTHPPPHSCAGIAGVDGTRGVVGATGATGATGQDGASSVVTGGKVPGGRASGAEGDAPAPNRPRIQSRTLSSGASCGGGDSAGANSSTNRSLPWITLARSPCCMNSPTIGSALRAPCPQ